eukprot:318624-Amphidinium_carterae.2
MLPMTTCLTMFGRTRRRECVERDREREGSQCLLEAFEEESWLTWAPDSSPDSMSIRSAKD